MSNLKTVEKRYFEDLFEMESGYVLESFTNTTYAEFFRECVNVNIDDDKYSFNGKSKAKRLRAFWEIEPDNIVGKVLLGLLEVWKYENDSPNENDRNKFNKCVEITHKLLGVRYSEIVTDDDFLKKDFDEANINNLRIEPMLLPILKSRLEEVRFCMQIKSSLATIFLCGSILEGILLGAAQQNPEIFNRSQSSPKDEFGKVKKLSEWTLNELINVAHNIGFLGLDVKRFSHVLRDFRNYIHPYQQMLTKFNPDEHTSQICFQVLKATIADLSLV